jgi:hypothetical protein
MTGKMISRMLALSLAMALLICMVAD